MKDGFSILKMQAALADGAVLPCYLLAKRMGVPPKQVGRRMPRCLSLQQVSRRRVDGEPGWHYFLTPEQVAQYRVRAAAESKARPADLTVYPVDIPGRLSFLRMLKEKTLFRDYAVLDLIIADYERAQQRLLAD